ncbi:MAG: tetratricopeptide repeat protein [Chloroflexota bacterium]
MSNQENTHFIRVQDEDELSPPPRLLLWIVVGLFVLFIAGGIGFILFMQSKAGLSSLFDSVIKLAIGVTLVGVVGAIVFRKRLPRRMAPIVVIALVAAWLIGGAAFIVIYRNSLAPGQRETAKFYLPFMKTFDPPLPAPDSSLPTPIPGEQSDISADQLLQAPLTLNTPVPTAALPAAIPVQASATALPTTEASPTPTLTPTPDATEAAVASDTTQNVSVSSAAQPPPSARLYGFTVVKQTWNNCGPANITMALSYYGWKQGQEVAQSYLRPDKEDKNVNPSEIVSFVNENTGVRALTRMGGTINLLKAFIANKIPVLIETGYMYEGSSWLGHYQTVVGYDDSLSTIYIYDSYLGTGENGAGMPRPYDTFDKDWENFNRTFIAVYSQDDENKVRGILGNWVDPIWAAENAAQVAQTEARTNPQNPFAWYNLGSSLTRLGQYKEAAAAYDQARRVGELPWRITLYQFGPFEAYYNVKRYDDVMALVTSNLNNGGEYVEETYYWEGKVQAAQGNNNAAADSFRQALKHNPRFVAAQDALSTLPA